MIAISYIITVQILLKIKHFINLSVGRSIKFPILKAEGDLHILIKKQESYPSSGPDLSQLSAITSSVTCMLRVGQKSLDLRQFEKKINLKSLEKGYVLII
ncbi:hypothetical protein V1477_008175 [Vespula maculifrons]|uniref:Uncharacterized protein n=1 Tax=Vespula maculifrons TaxID=7453 RepID=A0ABD2CCA0_VESMC